MSAHRVLLATACSSIGRGLSRSLASYGIAVEQVRADPFASDGRVDQAAESALSVWLAAQPPFSCMILAPITSGGSDAPMRPDAVGNTLAASFVAVKTAIGAFEESGGMGRIIALVPGDAAMGDPDSTTDSAIAGGVLSLFRTVALELGKTSVSVNTIMYALSRDADGRASVADRSLDGVALLINSLLSPESQCINGQEIFSMGATDVGRLHP